MEIADTEDCAVIGSALWHYLQHLEAMLEDDSFVPGSETHTRLTDNLERAKRLYAECDW